MRKIYFIIILLTALHFIAGQSPSLPDTQKILSIMMQIPEYLPYIVPGSGSEVTESEILWNASGIFSMKDEAKYGEYFRDGGIDSTEEYCTAYIILKGNSGYAALDQTLKLEFPDGKEKYLRLLAMWKKAKGINGYYFSEYFDIFPVIYAAAKKEGFAVTDQEAKDYFMVAIEKQIRSSFSNAFLVADKNFPDSAMNIITGIWKDFILNPGDETYFEQHVFSGMLYCLGETVPKYKALDEAYTRGVATLCGNDYLYGWESVRYDYSSHEDEVEAFQIKFIKSLGVK